LFPVPLSSAVTLRIPLTSISKVTSICGTPRGAGGMLVKVTFEIDVNGILKVTAEDKGTGNKNNIVINSNTNRLSPEEIERMIKDAERFAEEDKKVKERVDAKNELESYVYSLKTQIADKDKLGGKLSSDEKSTIEKEIEEKIKWLDENQASADVEDFKAQKKSIEDVVTPIMTKLYQGQQPPSPGSDVPPTGDEENKDEL